LLVLPSASFTFAASVDPARSIASKRIFATE
jgi:hypothetical protein